MLARALVLVALVLAFLHALLQLLFLLLVLSAGSVVVLRRNVLHRGRSARRSRRFLRLKLGLVCQTILLANRVRK